MGERFPSVSSLDTTEADASPVAFTVASGERNTFPTYSPDGKATGNVFVKKAESENAELAGGYVHEQTVEQAIDQHEGLSDQEKRQLREELLGKTVTHFLVRRGESVNGISEHITLTAIAGGERIGGGGTMAKREQESGLLQGRYVHERALERLEALMTAPVEADEQEPVDGGMPMLAPVPSELPSMELPEDRQSPNQRPIRTMETIDQAMRREEREKKRKKRWWMAAGATALVAIGMFLPANSGDNVEAREAATISVQAEADVEADSSQEAIVETQEQTVEQEPEVLEAEQSVDTSAYEYPWNWAEAEFGEGDGSEAIRVLSGRAQEAGHTVVFHEQGADLWVEIDGVSDTASVVNVLNSYR